ncbi:Mutator mutT protein [Lysobacter dokdonensis DS-58]|uniref:8-oxo-dGTP diphosphatase n=1 Tax=Lysobacter dokdonensis DS-58 TaxID=1300345 RepID=A0A0A2WJG4_9GAMM|nr:Nudix family hydrolase [Lysobacter dokdonensis]KGQ18862.1 Mutator mutT protein [Lysobacter dokdonensis DS-58]
MSEVAGPPVEVVAGVIRDKTGRILLARRTEGRDLAGLWEFPGGKREPGETPEAALARELHEELGITVDCGAPLIAVPQRYPHKRLRLDVRQIAAWRGTVKGHEGQALVWAPPHTLATYAMPPADIPVVAALLQPDRYLVTPAPNGSDAAWLEWLEAALVKGVRRVQLRAPHCPPARWARLVEAAVDACRRHGADVLINGDLALARAMDAGVHLRAEQLAELDARPFPKDQRVAASCHTLADLQRAQAIGCDFAVLGPVADTPTHPGETPIGWDGFARLREDVALPIYAIGGMTVDDIAIARANGAQGIAAIRALWG